MYLKTKLKIIESFYSYTLRNKITNSEKNSPSTVLSFSFPFSYLENDGKPKLYNFLKLLFSAKTS